MRGDGVTIRKATNSARGWEIYLPSGDRPQQPNQFGENGFVNTPAWGYSLTDAKYTAEGITVDSPLFVRVKR